MNWTQLFGTTICLGLLACTTTQELAEKEVPPPAHLEKLYAERWVSDTEHVVKDYLDKGQRAKLDVQYEVFYTFAPGKLTKTMVCHFKSPVPKTLIVDTESPVEFSGKDSLKVLVPSFQKQEYNAVLKRVDKKGPDLQRSVYCSSSIEAKAYKYEIRGDELILKPVEEILKLKKYKQN